MVDFAKRERQKIVNGYLNATGKNTFVPMEFLEWLRKQPDHPAHKTFFGQSDEAAAMAHRCDLVRRWVSGLRVNIRMSDAVASTMHISVTEYEVPALVSPLSGRSSGGGYQPMSDELLPELRRQASRALQTWLARYGGALALSAVSTDSVKQMVALIDAVDEEGEAAA